MPPWLAAKAALGLARWAWLAIAAVALLAGIWWLNRTEAADDKANQTIGETRAVNQGQTVTLDQIGKANEAGNDVRTGTSDAKWRECLRGSAPGYERSCDRYKPVEPVPGGSAAAD